MSFPVFAPDPHTAPGTRDAAREYILRAYAPATAEENFLAEQIAGNYWRLLSARRAEAALLDDLAANSESADLALGKALASDAGLTRILRYVTAAERALHLSIEHFRRSRSAASRTTLEAARQKTAADRAEADTAFREFHEAIARSEAEIQHAAAAMLAEEYSNAPSAVTADSAFSSGAAQPDRPPSADTSPGRVPALTDRKISTAGGKT